MQTGRAPPRASATHLRLARDMDGGILVADSDNQAVRRVRVEAEVSKVEGNGKAAYADGRGRLIGPRQGPSARFDWPSDVVVNKEGTIVVADYNNRRLRKMVGRQVSTLAGGSEAGTADGAGAGARFTYPFPLVLDERGRLLVAEDGQVVKLRDVDASLAPSAWMGPVDAAAEAQEEKPLETEEIKDDYGKLMKDGELADVVLVLERERFPADCLVLAARSEYFRGLLLWGCRRRAGSRRSCWRR